MILVEAKIKKKPQPLTVEAFPNKNLKNKH
jgi:hypothetical protein